MDAAGPAADGAFDEFEALVLAIAAGGVAGRGEATRWSHCRALLLGGAYRDRLPGFVIQCGSVSKFRDFIALYDPSPAARVVFARQALAAAHQRRHALPATPATAEATAARSTEWTF